MKQILWVILSCFLMIMACNKAPKQKVYNKSQTIQTKQQKEVKLSNQDSTGTYTILLKNVAEGTNLYTAFISDSVTKNMVASLRDNSPVYIDEVSTQVIEGRVTFFLKGADQGTKTKYHELFLFVPQQGEFVEASVKEEVGSQKFTLTSETYSKLKSAVARKFMQDKIKSFFPTLSLVAPSIKPIEKNLAMN